MLKNIYHIAQLFLLRVTVLFLVRKSTIQTGSLLVIAPHPDDEILGVGGLILSALQQNCNVHIMFLTDGESSDVHSDHAIIRMERARLTAEVMLRLGIPDENQHRLHLADGRVPRHDDVAFDDVVTRLQLYIDAIKPDTVLATHSLDYWPFDHVACSELAEAALKLSKQKPVLYFFWVWAWFNLKPWHLLISRPLGLFVIDISPWIKAKNTLVDIYLSSKAPSGQPWSGVLPVSLRQAFRFHIEVLEKRDVV